MKQQLHKSLRLAATLLIALNASSVWGSYPIDITFSAEGESTNVQSVTVTNLTQTAISPVTLSGTDILRLVDPDDPDAIEGTEELKVVTQPILTPNPSMGDGTLIFDAKSDGPIRVSVYTAGGMLLDAATLNVTKASGIRTNEELAFLRAMGMKNAMQKGVQALKTMDTSYETHVEEAEGVGGQFRRIFVDYIFEDAF